MTETMQNDEREDESEWQQILQIRMMTERKKHDDDRDYKSE